MKNIEFTIYITLALIIGILVGLMWQDRDVLALTEHVQVEHEKRLDVEQELLVCEWEKANQCGQVIHLQQEEWKGVFD